MSLGIGRAAGKVILFGDNAVVYGRPARHKSPVVSAASLEYNTLVERL